MTAPPKRLMKEDEIPAFVEAVIDSWLRYLRCRPRHVPVWRRRTYR